MTIYEKMMNIDRRWIYLLLGLSVLVPAFYPFEVPVSVTPEVKSVYEFVDKLEAGDYLFLGIDYDPSSMAELHPMSKAIIAQCFSKDVNLIISSLSQNGPGMAEQIINEIAGRYRKIEHEDYCFLGYKPYPALVILNMGMNFQVTFPRDYGGTPLDSIPIMQGIKNYNDCKAVIAFTAGNVADMWIAWANARFGIPLALGVTGVMASDYYPYLQTGQLFGLLPGMKGAAEYESLFMKGLKKADPNDPSLGEKRAATESMAYQTTSHIIILVFIIISNIGFFLSRKEEKKI
ncbi:MAG: hypothetical protein GY855_00855 [candidate division Zixibacteria bacterium]|nr:hypothetical protein [candidate division Zixibacteria bacterium]